MKTEVRIKMNEYGDLPKVEINDRERLNAEAGVALALLERWGMCAGMNDGEDSAGRSKGRLATPEEVVERAFTIASLVFKTAREREMTVVLPSFAEIDAVQASHKAEKAGKKALA